MISFLSSFLLSILSFFSLHLPILTQNLTRADSLYFQFTNENPEPSTVLGMW